MSKKPARASIRDPYFPSQDWEVVANSGGAPEAKEGPFMPSPTPSIEEVQNSGTGRQQNTVRDQSDLK